MQGCLTLREKRMARCQAWSWAWGAEVTRRTHVLKETSAWRGEGQAEGHPADSGRWLFPLGFVQGAGHHPSSPRTVCGSQGGEGEGPRRGLSSLTAESVQKRLSGQRT